METQSQNLRKALAALVIESEHCQEARLQEMVMELKTLIAGIGYRSDDLGVQEVRATMELIIGKKWKRTLERELWFHGVVLRS